MAQPLIAIGVRPLSGRNATGRAAVVTLRHPPDAILPEIVDRSEVDLVPDDLPGRVFHAAVRLAPDEAPALVHDVERVAAELALASLRRLVAAGRSLGRPAGVALVVDDRAPDPPDDLDAILASHTMIHSAETALYRDALAEAAAALGVPVVRQPLRRVETAIAIAAAVGVTATADTLADWGRVVGRPWRREHKQAAMAAWSLTAGTGTGLR